jgi:hypothetical protein
MTAKPDSKEVPKGESHEQHHHMPGGSIPESEAEGKALSVDRRQHGATVDEPDHENQSQAEDIS